MRESKKSIRAGVAFAAALVLISLTLRGVIGMWRPDGGTGGEPKFYRGPVLPLTAISGGEGLTVERSVDFDFAPYGEEQDSVLAADEALITDTYRLTNPGTEAVSIKLAYPFEGALNEDEKYLPALTLNGSPMDTERLPSLDATQKIDAARGWEDFRDAVTENDYLAEALSPAADLNETVIVYAVTDIQYNGTEEMKYPELVLSYDIPGEGVEVWTYLLGSFRTDEETGREHKGIQFLEQNWGLLIIRGGDIENLSFQAYNDDHFPADQELDGVTYELKRYEAGFSEVVREIAQYHSPEYGDLLYAGAMKRLADDRYHTAEKVWQNFSALFDGVLRENVLIFDVFTLNIEPGQTVELKAVFRQKAGTENSGFGTAADTYDMATRLGSTLVFSGLSASITNSGLVEITDQNFGFAQEQGITSVELNLDTERYYLRVTPKA